MSMLERATELQRRRLERAEEALNIALGTQRRASEVLASVQAEVVAHRAHVDAGEDSLWAELAGRLCGPSDFLRMHASRAVLQAQLQALSETLCTREREYAAAGEAVMSQREERNGAALRLEKFVHLVTNERRHAQSRMESLLDEQLDDIALQRQRQADQARLTHA